MGRIWSEQRRYETWLQVEVAAAEAMSAAVVRVKNTSRALAISVDGNGRFGYLDPYQGARLAVAEASRNVACVGAEPIGATNNLNFGNPERPEIMLEEDLEEERFFVTVRKTYWTAPDGSATRKLCELLINKLDF